mmetsp:Transcript_31247/g.66321  ORF Transcript_31247/g.66321 Transcript_31247/m.66321 type:complete len:271 (-) Transcript_31247:930-1742(-)
MSNHSLPSSFLLGSSFWSWSGSSEEGRVKFHDHAAISFGTFQDDASSLQSSGRWPQGLESTSHQRSSCSCQLLPKGRSPSLAHNALYLHLQGRFEDPTQIQHILQYGVDGLRTHKSRIWRNIVLGPRLDWRELERRFDSNLSGAPVHGDHAFVFHFLHPSETPVHGDTSGCLELRRVHGQVRAEVVHLTFQVCRFFLRLCETCLSESHSVSHCPQADDFLVKRCCLALPLCRLLIGRLLQSLHVVHDIGEESAGLASIGKEFLKFSSHRL